MQSTTTKQDRHAARLLVAAARTQKLWRLLASSCSTCAALRRRHRVNSQLYSTALSRDQASLVFGLAVKMVRMNPDLAGVVLITGDGKADCLPQAGDGLPGALGRRWHQLRAVACACGPR